MTDSPVSLASLMTSSKTVTIDFPGYTGFTVDLTYLAREELIKLRKRCLKTKFDRRTHQAEEEMDEDKFAAEFTKACVKNWKGLKLKYLEDLILVDLGDNDPDAELAYDFDNALSLVTNSSEFDNWINEVVFDLANFRGKSKGKTVEKTRNVAA